MNGGLKPGYTAGFHCLVCHKELQVSPNSLPVAQQGWTFCQSCGIPLYTRLKNIAAVGFTPDALATIATNINTLSKQKDVKPGQVDEWMKTFEALVDKLK